MNRADLYRFRSTRTSLWVRFLATGMMQAQRSQPSLPAHSPKRGSMNVPRISHTATLLSNGDVLVAGGDNSTLGGSPLSSAQLFNLQRARGHSRAA